MPSIWESKGKNLHTRKIDVAIYDYDGQRIIVEGVLNDERFQASYTMTGEIIPACVIHHMAIRLLVNCSNLMIEDIDVDIIAVPRDVCRETIDCLVQVKGLTIAKGFTYKVNKLAGGIRGCTHLLELLQAMTPAVIQGFAAHQERKPLASSDPARAKMLSKFLVNTCWAWREDGPYAAMCKKHFGIK